MVYARGLHPHLRQVHHMVIKTFPKVVSPEPDYSPTIVDQGYDFSHTTKVAKKNTPHKSAEKAPGNLSSRVIHSHNFIDQLNAHVAAGKNFMRIDYGLSVEGIMGTKLSKK